MTRTSAFQGLNWLLLLAATLAASPAAAQFQIRNGETPTLSGALNGTVRVSGGAGSALQVTLDFGDVSPVNTSSLVRAQIPVVIRSERSYQLALLLPSSSTSGDANALRPSDIGVGLLNLRRLQDGRVCTAPHTVFPPYDTDPALAVTRSGRAGYPATLASAEQRVVVLNGPALSTRAVNPGGGVPSRPDGYAFDLILVLVPQFFTPGTSSLTLLLEMSDGPNLPCP